MDMTDEMLALARENQLKAGVQNVEFLKGEIENIPLPDNSVDVIISNCVINLSGDKDRVLKEAFRVLKPGGRFAVSDVVTRGGIPEEIRQNMLLWVGCVAGALEENDYRAKLAAAGFENIGLEPTRIYRAEDARSFLADKGMDLESIAPLVDGKFMSAFVRATKPVSSKSCCLPTCWCELKNDYETRWAKALFSRSLPDALDLLSYGGWCGSRLRSAGSGAGHNQFPGWDHVHSDRGGAHCDDVPTAGEGTL